MADVTLDCFTTLLESIPGWIADLESIVTNATERQRDILHEEQPVNLQPIQPRRLSKSSSVRTSRSKDADQKPDALEVLKVDEPVPTVVEKQVPHMTQSDALRLSQRKRKTASVCSDRQSGPLKYRSRSMVVIYYDGEVQKRFEDIVRQIGSRRNALRKGRTKAQVYELSRNASSGSDGSSGEDSGTYVPRVMYRSARMRQSPGAGSPSEGLAAFDRLDGFLEQAQAQCERAAHQILRDGDCGLEIQAAKTHFTEAEKHCESELPVWRKKIEAFQEKERLEDERRKIEEEKEKEREEKPPPDYSSSEKLVVDDAFNAAAPLEVDIEPDHSDGGDDSHDFNINLMSMARSRPYNLRASRLTAAH